MNRLGTAGLFFKYIFNSLNIYKKDTSCALLNIHHAENNFSHGSGKWTFFFFLPACRPCLFVYQQLWSKRFSTASNQSRWHWFHNSTMASPLCVCVYKLKPNFNGSFLLLSMLFFSLSHTHRHFRVLWFVWSSVVKKEKKQRGVEQPTTSLL